MIRPLIWLPIWPLLLVAQLLGQPASAEQPGAEQPGAAQFAEATRHHSGTGVLQNFASAQALYQQAADLGHAAAQNRLGQYYHAGLGGAPDQQQALRWLRAAAAQGDPQHIFDLATALEQGADGSSDPGRAAVLYQQASTLGHVDAAVSLGVLYQNGTGVAQDPQRALALYQGPAAQGHARAQNNLGLLYVRGTGVAQDYSRAAALFAKSAAQGQVTAMGNLSVMYGNGFGVAQSDAKAADWERRASQQRQASALGGAIAANGAPCGFDPRLTRPDTGPSADNDLQARQRAAEAGDPVAQFLTGWQLCHRAAASAGDLAAAARWFRAAAGKGHGPSMANLSGFYLQGRGVPQDYVLGYMWLTLAQSAGHPLPLADSAALRQRMTSAQINDAQQRAASLWQQIRSP